MEQFKVDLSNCDREPIHIPGRVQAHGFLLAYRPGSGQIEFASENVKDFTDIAAKQAIGLTMQDFMELQKPIHFRAEHLEQVLAGIEAGKTEFFVRITGKKQSFNLIGHKSDELVVLEFEPVADDVTGIKLHNVIGDLINPIQQGISLSDLLTLLAKHVKNIIQYDRVMVYKYWEDWHGEVVAAEKNEDLEPFLGLHYTASDIPKQARELYLTNLVRIITDVNSVPSPLVTTAGNNEPLDLTHSTLRAVSPMHIQYLQNMGVRASFSISLVHQGKLWGLIACHNYAPRFINFESRQACKLLAQLLSTTLNAKVDEEQALTSNQYKEEADKIFDTLYATGDVPQSLINNGRSILNIGQATGAALVFEEKIYTIGQTPSTDEIKALTRWLQSNAQTRLYHTNNLPKFYTQAAQYSDVASGLMAVELFKSNGEYILWFKPELHQTVKWAGKPQKPIEVDTTGATRLTPRQSFAIWYEEVKHTSQSWENAEILTALRLREGILQVISQKADETRKLNEKLKEAYDELDTFSYTISHDLRTPLSIIRSYTEILMEELEEMPTKDVKAMLHRIIEGTENMESLIKEVLAYSRLSGFDASSFDDIDMSQMLNEVLQQAQSKHRNNAASVQMVQTPNIKAPRAIAKQIFGNLVENAIKYSYKQKKPSVVIKGERLENEILYEIRDNGIGIDANQGDKVFMLFKRLDNAVNYEGTGIGLATVKRLVKKIGGRIWFESELNKGTTFYVTFPIVTTDEKDN